MSRDKDYTRLMNSRRWQRLRIAVLNAHPLCANCEKEGRVAPATEVHHIVPIETRRGNIAAMAELAYSPSNLMPLCHRCHYLIHQGLCKGSKQERAKRTAAQTQDYCKRFFGIEPADPGATFSDGV